MKLDLDPGKYVLAISGGVDSAVLLDLCSKLDDGYEFVVAHFDHGIRENSSRDQFFVAELAKKYQFGYVYGEGKLGLKTSEEKARVARYNFLRKVLADTDSKAIITAHHQDDVLETMIMNLMRGTGRKGLSSLDTTSEIVRPLLNAAKHDIKMYAEKNNLEWVEDETNQDTKYKRNEIRIEIIPKLSKKQRDQLIELWFEAKNRNKAIDQLLDDIGSADANLSRSILLSMSHKAASELVATWLRNHHLRDFDKKAIERIVIGAKTLKAGSLIDVVKKAKVKVTKSTLQFLDK
ncbi:MAG: tRNA lysidine(34) synthetase TilS [bacterium]|nr:tRNA lysidine(34) synthetase TilS [bacterium]